VRPGTQNEKEKGAPLVPFSINNASPSLWSGLEERRRGVGEGQSERTRKKGQQEDEEKREMEQRRQENSEKDGT